jgi:hypothetical protein
MHETNDLNGFDQMHCLPLLSLSSSLPLFLVCVLLKQHLLLFARDIFYECSFIASLPLCILVAINWNCVHLLLSFQIQENLNLLRRTRDNIRKIMNQYVFSSSFFYHVDFMMA